MNFGNFTPRSDVSDTDVLVGERGTQHVGLLRPESRWTALTVRSWLGGYFAPKTVLTVTALKAIVVSGLTTGHTVIVLGYATVGDGGGGVFRYDSTSVVTADGGTIFAPNAGSGRWLRDYSGAVNVKWFGATGAGAATDDTNACQAALNTGLDVYVPRTANYYKLSVTLSLVADGQIVIGDGRKSKLVQTGTNANSTVLYASALGHNTFAKLYAVPGTTVISLYDGYGFKLSACDQSSVRNCYVTGSRRGGVALFNCNYCKVLNNWLTDSVVAVPDIQSATGNDIYLGGACSWNLVNGNHCINGCGVGIAVQTLTPGDVADHNTINANFVKNQGVYGIMLYLFNATDSCKYNTISNNHIDTITGNIPSDIGLYNYGAGIYVQTALFTLITGNQLRNTNAITVAAQDLQQVAAAIGISDSAGVVITSNTIETANYHGIWCKYGSSFTATGRGALVADNTIYKHKQNGIFFQDWTNAVVSNNRVYGDSSGSRAPHGIRIAQVAFTQSDDFQLIGNRVDHSSQGIFCDGTVNRVVLSGNIVRDANSYNIYLSASCVEVSGNVVVGASGSTGIAFIATCVEGFCLHNRVETGAGTGILQSAGSSVLVDPSLNSVSATTQFDTDGVSDNYYRVLANAANPTVKNARYVRQSNVVTMTNFDDGVQGQRFVLKALAGCTIADGATIQLAGSANFTMASGDIWEGLYDGTIWREVGRSVN